MFSDALNPQFSICIGFALAGALASGYQDMAARSAGFELLLEGVAPKTFAAVPLLVFAAPFIIMRKTLRGTKIERRPRPCSRASGADVRHVLPDDAAGRRTGRMRRGSFAGLKGG